MALHRLFPHGGLQRDAVATARACQARGHEVTLVTQRLDGPAPEDLDLRLEPVPGRTNHGRATRFGARLAELRADHRPDVVLGFDKVPGLDAYFVGDPCYAARARAKRGSLSQWLPRDRAFAALERAVFRPGGARRLLLLHGAQGAPFQAEYGTEEERFRVLPPGVALDRRPGPWSGAARARVRAELGLDDGTCLMMHIGSDHRRKGLDRAILGLASLEDRSVHLAVAGADDPAPFRTLTRERGVAPRVHFLGPRDDVPALLQAADLLVHPARSEPGGAVLLEALVAGRPVLASAACGYSEYVRRSGAGDVTPEPFDQSNFEASLAGLVEGDLARLGNKARLYAEATPELHGMHDAIVDALEELSPR